MRRVHTATPSSRYHEDGVEVDATMQHERAVKFDFHTASNHAGSTSRLGSGSATLGTVCWLSHVLLKATKTRPRS